jgi:hypothetical protein
MKTISLSKLLGRKGMIKNNFLSRTKNYMRDDDDMTGSCVCTNMERYYELDERTYTIFQNRRRLRELKV